MQRDDLYSSAGPGPAGQTIYTTRHKHLRLGMIWSDLLLQTVVWYLLSRKTLLMIVSFYKYESLLLLLLCCLIIKMIKFCLCLLFIICKCDIIRRWNTQKTRRSHVFCNTNTQTAQIHKCGHAWPHTLSPFFSVSLSLCSHSHTQTHITVSHSLVWLLFDILCDLWPWLGCAGWTLGPAAGSSPT